MWLEKPKNLHVSWQFDFELIMHHVLSITLMDLHKTLQPIAKF